MHYFTLNVFLILLLTWSSPVSSQTPLQAAISQLNSCASNCIARSAAFVRCGATDFGCQCAHQDAIIGSGARFSPQSACILSACGRANTADVRQTFSNICALEAASSAIGLQSPPSSQTAAQSNPPATFSSVNTPAPATTAAAQSSFDPPPSTALDSATTSILSDTSVAATTDGEAPASFTPTTESLPVDTSLPIPVSSIVESLASVSVPAVFTQPASAVSGGYSAPSFTPSVGIPDSAASPVSTSTSQASSIADSNSNQTFSTPSATSSRGKGLPSLAIVGITILCLGFVATILGLAYIQLRRRKRKSYIATRRLDDKLRPTTEDGPPDTRDGYYRPPPSSAGGEPAWDARGQNKISAMMGMEIGPRPRMQPETEERPKSRGKGAGESGVNTRTPPPQFPMTGIPQGFVIVNPPSPSNGVQITGTGSSSGSAQPLKSAMKKPKDRPKSRPLMTGDGNGNNFKFGFDPLGSNPRTPT